jgi:outer membrane lipoprotein-sorting protein
MRSLLIVFACLIAPLFLYAQPKGFHPVADLPAFQQKLSGATSSLQSLRSDFAQIKHLSMLQDKLTAKGLFYYQKQDKVRIEYQQPYTYLLVMNAGQVLVKDEQKSTRVNAGASKVMRSVNRIMLDCMRGTVFTNPDFKVEAFEGSNSYLLVLTPANDAIKKMLSRIEVHMNKSNFDVQKLSMTEPGGDFTEMNFSNTQRNLKLDDALFKTR